MRWNPGNILLPFLLIVAFAPGEVKAGRIVTGDPDSLFFRARELAFQGEYRHARKCCYRLIDSFPDYTDAYILAGNTWAWEEQFDSARYWLREALLIDPGRPDAIEALARVEYWAGTPGEALPAIEKGLEIRPRHPGLLYQKALVFSREGKRKETWAALNALADTVPQYPGADSLYRLARAVVFPSSLGVEYYYDHFSLPYLRNWHVLSLSVEGEACNSRFLLKLNNGYLARREETFGNNTENQLELDAYPSLGYKSYLYLNAGISPGNFFPRYRAGGEWFYTIPHDMVVSAGFRYLKWTDGFLFYTGSLEKYAGKYWLTLRPYVFHKPYGWSSAWFLTARRYLGDEEQYLQVMAGTGTSPDEPMLASSDMERLHTAMFRAGGQYRLAGNWMIHLLAGYSREEFADGEKRNRYDLRLGFRYGF